MLPPLSLKTLDGRRFELRPSGSRRQFTALVFLSPWCESYLATTRPEFSLACRNIRQQVNSLAPDPRIRWIGIASGLWANRDDLHEYRAHYKVTIPLTLDAAGTQFRAFRVNNVPTILIADADGRIVRRVDGGTTSDAEALLKNIVGS